jgi:hypothetical protein
MDHARISEILVYVQVIGSWRLLVCLGVQSTLFTCSMHAVSKLKGTLVIGIYVQKNSMQSPLQVSAEFYLHAVGFHQSRTCFAYYVY